MARHAASPPPPPPPLRTFIADTFTAIMTSHVYHATRCRVIKATWTLSVPSTHYMFYSDADDPALPAIAMKVAKYQPQSNESSGDRLKQLSLAQRKWLPALVHAYGVAARLRTRWTMVVDDDTFVVPENVERVLMDYDPTLSVLVGQTCTCPGCGFAIPEYAAARRAKTMCGGAGWAMSTPLHKRLLGSLSYCEARYSEHMYLAGSSISAAGFVLGNDLKPGEAIPRAFVDVETQSDRFLGRCFYEVLNVTIVDRREFCSQPPWFYWTPSGERDKPDGFGRPATFHYVKGESLLSFAGGRGSKGGGGGGRNGGDGNGPLADALRRFARGRGASADDGAVWTFLAHQLMPGVGDAKRLRREQRPASEPRKVSRIASSWPSAKAWGRGKPRDRSAATRPSNFRHALAHKINVVAHKLNQHSGAAGAARTSYHGMGHGS